MRKKMLISLISLTNDLSRKIGKGCEEIEKEIKYLQNVRGLGGTEVNCKSTALQFLKRKNSLAVQCLEYQGEGKEVGG